MRYLISLIAFFPYIVHGQRAPNDFSDLVGMIISVISAFIPLVFGITLVVILWGIAKAWILNAGDESEIERGKGLVTVGIVVLVIMSGIWGILSILQTSLFG